MYPAYPASGRTIPAESGYRSAESGDVMSESGDELYLEENQEEVMTHLKRRVQDREILTHE